MPKLGWLIVWLRSPLLRLLTVFVAPALFVIIAIRRIWNEPDEDEIERTPDAPSQVAPLA